MFCSFSAFYLQEEISRKGNKFSVKNALKSTAMFVLPV